MKKSLNDYTNDIQKCSKCGLCMSVCPVYKVTGNDCVVSRGKFIMLNGIIKGDLKLNNNVNQYLDMCLKCNACKDFCPSGIDARKIFLAAKEEYFQSSNSVFKNFWNFNSFNFLMQIIKFKTNAYRALQLDKFVSLFYPIFSKFYLGKKFIFANNLLKCDFNNKAKKNNSKNIKAVYFKGCVNEYINPKTKKAVEYVLAKMGVDVIAVDFKCCGAPFLSEGNVQLFKDFAEYNISQIPDEFDYFLTDCATCQNSFKDYENYVENSEFLEKIKIINAKSININDFLVKYIENIEFKQKKSFTFHKPCHLDDIGFINDFLSKCTDAKYIEMKDFDSCCGFAGTFALKNIDISDKISTSKVNNALSTKVDYIVTSCPACVMGLTQGLVEIGETKEIPINFVEFIANNICE